MSIVVFYYPILCPVVREWWAGADCMREKSVGLRSKPSLEWASCSLIIFSVKLEFTYVCWNFH